MGRLRGDHDFFPIEVAQHIAQAIPGAQLMIVPGAGHGTFMQRPELMNLAVSQFLHLVRRGPEFCGVDDRPRGGTEAEDLAPARLYAFRLDDQ